MNYPRTERHLLWLATGLLFAGMFINLGKQPLYLEEPRRALIAMEMWERGNMWAPTELGAYYYNKPPVFNWVLMGSAALLGGFHEWAMRLPTVLSTIGLCLLLFFMGRRYVDASFGWVSALLFAANGSILLFFSHLGEIDLFYALTGFAGFAALFHFYQTRRDLLLFTVFYGLNAIGFLTKGMPSILFIGLSLGAWFAWQRDWRRLFSWAHLAGIAVFGLIVGGYLYQYSLYNGLERLLPEWIGQAGERTVAEQGIRPLLSHLVLYPLDTLKDLLPFSLLAIFLWRKDVLGLLRRNAWVAFSALVFAANFPVYWLSPGAKQRYLYMLFPLLLIVFTWAWRHRHELSRGHNLVFRVLTGLLLVFFASGAPLLAFIPELSFLPYEYMLTGVSILALSFLCYLFWKRKGLELALLITAMAFARIVFDLTVLPQRAHRSGAQQDKELAIAIQGIVQDQPLYIYRFDRISHTTVYYLNRLRGDCLKRSYREEPGVYYLAEANCVERPFTEILEFEYDKRRYILFQFL